MNCILCRGASVALWNQDSLRPYLRCDDCSLVFVPRDYLLSSVDEKKRYDTHENNEDDLRYREYLTKITTAIIPFLGADATGLDFGCGASTLLSKIFLESGFVVDSYDLYYHSDQKFRAKTYDFIVLSEVIEHLSDPIGGLEGLKLLLKPGGQFFIKTKYLPPQKEMFGNWFYKNDPTHIQFFNHQSMEKLASLLGMQGPMALSSADLCRLWS